MGKLVSKIVVFIGLFLGIYLGLKQVDWMTLFHIKETTESNEEKLGELIWESLSESETIIIDESVTNAMDSLMYVICESSDINSSKIKIHVIQNSEVNAFALPDYHMVIHTGLITASENEGELAGVLGHELAHMELDHVMKKMVKEIGLATLVSLTAGNAGGQVVMESLRYLTSTAYDRSLEEEADIKAVDYLVNAKIDPEQFANFMFRLGGKANGIDQYLAWVGTHPESRERADYIITYSLTKKDLEFKPILSDESWVELQLVADY